jgi:hypothetical protein
MVARDAGEKCQMGGSGSSPLALKLGKERRGYSL